MEARYDLGKFITESTIAQRRDVLSSGREASSAADPARTTAQGGAVPAMPITSSGAGADRDSINVGPLTLGTGIESSTAMGSDLWAAEALQEAETEVGVAVMMDRVAGAAVRVAGEPSRSADPSTDLGLTA
jgi:orotate phosphoribosyltransferase